MVSFDVFEVCPHAIVTFTVSPDSPMAFGAPLNNRRI